MVVIQNIHGSVKLKLRNVFNFTMLIMNWYSFHHREASVAASGQVTKGPGLAWLLHFFFSNSQASKVASVNS